MSKENGSTKKGNSQVQLADSERYQENVPLTITEQTRYGSQASALHNISTAPPIDQAEQQLTRSRSNSAGDGPLTLRRSTSASSASVDAVYDERYAAKKGKASEYEKRFDPDYLIVAGERRVFLNGVEYLFESDGAVNQLDSLNKKVDSWVKLKYLHGDRDGLSKEALDRLEAWHKGNDDRLDPDMVKQYREGKPLMITAFDFGCGDGRGVELWQDLAKTLEPLGVTLHVKAYDIMSAGPKSYISRLTSPILPDKYIETLKDQYGDELLRRRMEESYEFDSEEQSIIRNKTAEIEQENIRRRYYQEHRAQAVEEFGREHYQEMEKRGLLPRKDTHHEYLVDMFGSDFVDSSGSDEIKKALERWYGETIYDQREKEKAFEPITAAQIDAQKHDMVRQSYQQRGHDYNKRLLASYSPSQEDCQKLERAYGEDIYQKLSQASDFPRQIEKDILRDHYGDIAFAARTVQVENLKKIEKELDKADVSVLFSPDEECLEQLRQHYDEETISEMKTRIVDCRQGIITPEDSNKLRNHYGQDLFKQRVVSGDFPNNEDAIRLRRIYDREVIQTLQTIYAQQDKEVLVPVYGKQSMDRNNEKFPSAHDIGRLRAIFREEAYEAELERDDFPNHSDYKELRRVYGDEEIKKLRERNPKFSQVSADVLEAVYGDRSEGKRYNIENLGVYKHQNLEIEFLLGSIAETTVEDFKNAIGPVDVGLILYGSTSHIENTVEAPDLRNDFIKAMVAITKGCLIATLPGRQGRYEEIAEAADDVANGIRKEGEIVIKAAEIGVDMPYAVYTKKLLDEILGKVYSELLDPQAIDQAAFAMLENEPELDHNQFGSDETLPLMEGVELNHDHDRASIRKPNWPKVGVIAEGESHYIDIATKRNPAKISESLSEYLIDTVLTPLCNAALKAPDCLKDAVPDKVVDARYWGVVARGMQDVKADDADKGR